MRVFVLTGAGLSAESGLGTFRDMDGLWTRFDLNEVATADAYARDPAKVLDFYNLRRRNVLGAAPNAAHRALARLEQGLTARGDQLFLCTQNVDHLHELAGSASPIHMHGELLKARCLACGKTQPWRVDIVLDTVCPVCGATGRLRPDVVWFGETPLHLDEIEVALRRCDLFVSIGTSGSVYPAAGFVRLARAKWARTCEINLEPSDNAEAFDERRYGPATEAVPAWVEQMLGGSMI